MAKILLVEDDPLMVRMYQRKLVNDGYETQVAVDGEEGLVKMRSFRPDLILLDIMMPKLNGLQVLERLKSDPTTAQTPVIILTNLGGTQDDIERGLELGAVAYLVKSAYRPDEVIAKVKEILEGYTRSREIPKVAFGSISGSTRVLENIVGAALSGDNKKTDQSPEDKAKKELKEKDIKQDIESKSANIDQKAPPASDHQSPSRRQEKKSELTPKPKLSTDSSVKKSKEKFVSPQEQPSLSEKEIVAPEKKENAPDGGSPDEMIW